MTPEQLIELQGSIRGICSRICNRCDIELDDLVNQTNLLLLENDAADESYILFTALKAMKQISRNGLVGRSGSKGTNNTTVTNMKDPSIVESHYDEDLEMMAKSYLGLIKNPKEYAVFKDFVLLEMSKKNIAKKHGISEPTVRKIIKKCQEICRAYE